FILFATINSLDNLSYSFSEHFIIEKLSRKYSLSTSSTIRPSLINTKLSAIDSISLVICDDIRIEIPLSSTYCFNISKISSLTARDSFIDIPLEKVFKALFLGKLNAFIYSKKQSESQLSYIFLKTLST